MDLAPALFKVASLHHLCRPENLMMLKLKFRKAENINNLVPLKKITVKKYMMSCVL